MFVIIEIINGASRSSIVVEISGCHVFQIQIVDASCSRVASNLNENTYQLPMRIMNGDTCIPPPLAPAVYDPTCLVL